MEVRLLEILQHALGVDQYGRGPMYRCHFVTGPDTTDYPSCRKLVEMGLMTERAPSALSGGDPTFFVTDRGKEAVRRESPAPPKLTRSQRRYRQFLDADTGWSFKEWLQQGGGR